MTPEILFANGNRKNVEGKVTAHLGPDAEYKAVSGKGLGDLPASAKIDTIKLTGTELAAKNQQIADGVPDPGDLFLQSDDEAKESFDELVINREVLLFSTGNQTPGVTFHLKPHA